MHDLLTREQIAAWLDKITLKGEWGKRRDGISMGDVARLTGIPLHSIRWYRDPRARMSAARQHAISRLIAEYENGRIDFKARGYFERKEVVKVENPRPRVQYRVSFGPKGVGLKPVDRPKIGGRMPRFKDLLGG